MRDADCPVQQGLADENPDVDAVYRLVAPLPQSFRGDRRLALGPGSWCPFNSQNTAWWADAFPLLYLPAYCSFRMTDIWRGFVAQRIAWENNWGVLFHEPTVRQERNEHNLMRDFRDEVPGYLHNAAICEALGKLRLRPGVEGLGENLRTCYGKLVGMSLVDRKELGLLDAWLGDLDGINHDGPRTPSPAA
ncbi:MAG: STELLO glycosyltransferase family protein [Acidobacteriota bacterium]|nr:STELLO glycosyltransferase family protein [Acidobacteriota bacterium]